MYFIDEVRDSSLSNAFSSSGPADKTSFRVVLDLGQPTLVSPFARISCAPLMQKIEFEKEHPHVNSTKRKCQRSHYESNVDLPDADVGELVCYDRAFLK